MENRTFDSKREMDVLDALNEVKLQNRRHAKYILYFSHFFSPDTDKMLSMVSMDKELTLKDDDQEKIKNFKKRKLYAVEEDKKETEKAEENETEKEIMPPGMFIKPVRPPPMFGFKVPAKIIVKKPDQK